MYAGAIGSRTTDRGSRLLGLSDSTADALAKPIHIHQSQADTPVRVDAARPIRLLHINRSEADAVALRVFHQRRGMIETHRLIVQERGIERRRVVRLQIRARIYEQREARGVRFRKSIQRERRNRADNFFGSLIANALLGNTGTQLRLDLLHPVLGAFEPEGPPQLLRLASRKSSRDHRHSQQLLLEQRHAKRSRKNWFE